MPVVELERVSVRYGDVVALDEVATTVRRGEVAALLGANGAGKSTLLDVLLGLRRPTDGEVRLFGDVPGGGRRSRVGAMLQDAGLPAQVSVGELVWLVGRSFPSAWPVDEVLARVGLAKKRHRTVEVLSGGERQRLLLAMAIVGEPELLVLDEPTAAMDVDARRSFWERARASVGSGVTLVFATHDLSEADAVADRVLVLQRGQLIADASPAVLKREVARVTVTVTTDAPQDVVGEWAGVDRVEAVPDGRSTGPRRLRIWAAAPEAVVVPLVEAGYQMNGLRVDEADLEDAFAHLTATVSTADSPTATQGAGR